LNTSLRLAGGLDANPAERPIWEYTGGKTAGVTVCLV
jgi:hypothetical protein